MTDARRVGWPPEWVEQAKRGRVKPSSFANSAAGEARLRLWRENVPWPITDLEFAWAIRHAPPIESVPPSWVAVERVIALRHARRQLGKLSDRAWTQLIADVAPRLLAQAMVDATAIAAAVQHRVAAIEEIRSIPKDEPQVSGLTASSIKRAAAVVRARYDKQPTRPDVAAELHTTDSTLYRAMKRLGMGHWPPGPPDD